MNIRDLLTEKRLSHLVEMVIEISPDELHEKIENGEIFKLVDVSNPDEYQKAHLPGAVNIPLGQLKEIAERSYQKFQQIVVYGKEASACVASVAARILQDRSFSNVLALRGGKEAWQKAGYALEGKPVQEEEAA